MQQGIVVNVVDTGIYRFEITNGMPDQFTQAEAESIRDFILNLAEVKYSRSMSAGADLFTASTV
jgi:hypothetical protein